MSAYGTVKLGPNDYMWSCSICSALVVNRHAHDQWHVDQDAPRPRRLDITDARIALDKLKSRVD